MIISISKYLGVYSYRKAVVVLSKTGVFVFEVMRSNALTRRKIKYGDIIVQFNGNKVESVDGLFKYLTEETIGMPVRIGLLREGKLVEEIIVPEPSAN